MTYRVLRAPLSVIGNSFAQVFLQKSAEMYANKQNFVPLIHAITRKLALIATPIFILILAFGPQLFAFVLGDKWEIAGVYAQFLTPWLFVQFITAPVAQVAVIINKQEGLFYASLINNIIIVGAFVIGGLVFKSILTSFVLLSVMQMVYTFFLYRWILGVSERAVNNNQNNFTEG